MGDATVKLFATIQKLPREIQLLALAAAFILQSEALGFDTNDAYAAVTNLMKDPLTRSGRGSQFDAMKWHISEELAPDATNSTVV